MKRIHLAYAGIFVLLGAASCSNTAPTVTPGSGGSSGGGAGTTGSGGDTGAAGTSGEGGTGGSAIGGTTGTGGSSVAGTTGSAGDGGTTGSAGTTGSGGTAGAGAGGRGGGGGSASGGRGGSGGSAGSGGSGGSAAGGRGGSGTGGTGGATGSGGTGGADTGIVGSWDGSLILFPCQDARTSYDCTNVNCTGSPSTKTTTQMWKMGGQSGTVYTVTFNVRGVVEAYAYVGGTRASGTASISTNQNLFITGGTQQTAGNGNDYNTYELDVAPGATGAAKDVYYLNSVISSENPHTSTVTQHKTFPINYSAMIKVPGGSTVTFTSYDSNCALVQNCAAQVQGTCSMPRTVSLAGVDPAAPTSFMQPYQAPVGSYGQWIFFDITSVQ